MLVILSFLLPLIMVVLVFWASFKYIKAGLQLRIAAYMGPERGKAMADTAEKTVVRVTLGLLLVLALFVCVYTLRQDLMQIGGEPLCGDTPQNLCTWAHLKYITLAPMSAR